MHAITSQVPGRNATLPQVSMPSLCEKYQITHNCRSADIPFAFRFLFFCFCCSSFSSIQILVSSSVPYQVTFCTIKSHYFQKHWLPWLINCLKTIFHKYQNIQNDKFTHRNLSNNCADVFPAATWPLRSHDVLFGACLNNFTWAHKPLKTKFIEHSLYNRQQNDKNRTEHELAKFVFHKFPWGICSSLFQHQTQTFPSKFWGSFQLFLVTRSWRP